MKLIKNIFKSILFFYIITVIISLIYTFLLYNNIIPNNNSNIKLYSFIIGIILFMILGIISSTRANKKGWLVGLLNGMIVIIISIITKSLQNIHIDILYLAKLFIYLMSAILGGMIGINIKKEL